MVVDVIIVAVDCVSSLKVVAGPLRHKEMKVNSSMDESFSFISLPIGYREMINNCSDIERHRNFEERFHLTSIFIPNFTVGRLFIPV